MLFLCCWCCENLVLLVRGVGVFKAVRVCWCSRQGRAFAFVFVFKIRIQIDHKARQRKARARARKEKKKKKKKTRENFPCCDIARIDRLIASLLIQWIAWCMAILSWWRHLSGSCRLCVRSEREREREREKMKMKMKMKKRMNMKMKIMKKKKN